MINQSINTPMLENKVLYLEKMLSLLGMDEPQKREALKKLSEIIQSRILKDVLTQLPEEKRRDLVDKLKKAETDSQSYLDTILSLTKESPIKETIGKAVDEELTLFEENFMRIASVGQKQTLLDWLKTAQ